MHLCAAQELADAPDLYARSRQPGERQPKVLSFPAKKTRKTDQPFEQQLVARQLYEKSATGGGQQCVQAYSFELTLASPAAGGELLHLPGGSPALQNCNLSCPALGLSWWRQRSGRATLAALIAGC